MTGLLQRLFRGQGSETVLRFNRPLVILQSDDWGRVGIRDREGWEQLCASGIGLGEKPYDYYSLETSDDLHALMNLLRSHRDSAGCHPCLVMNFIMANIDFRKLTLNSSYVDDEIPLVPLTSGLPEPWHRPGLFEAFREGIHQQLFYPALHGLSHFCASAVQRERKTNDENSQLLRKLWHAATPYIHWRMPWVGFEYWDPALAPEKRFLSLHDQRALIQRASKIFHSMFSSRPFSACAPGYRANADTRTAWSEAGVRVVQYGPGDRIAPSLDQHGILRTYRNIEVEPATAPCELDGIIKRANELLECGFPAVVSIHSINFHSTLRDFRTSTLVLLDGFLTAIEKQWPDILYVNDATLFQIATDGAFETDQRRIKVGMRHE